MAGSLRPVPVWDLPTRLFHWVLVVAVVVNLVTGGEEGTEFVVHTVSGYVVLLSLLFRFFWGFIGSAHSRFADFVYVRSAVIAYSKQLLRLAPPRFVGHNPLGGWMIVVMLVALLATALTGLMSGDDEGAAGLLLPLVAPTGGEGLGEVHELFGNIVIALVILHVLGVLVDWMITRENLIRAMITGRKDLAEDIAAREPPLAPSWRGVALAVLVLAIGVVLVRGTDFGTIARGGNGSSAVEEEHENDD